MTDINLEGLSDKQLQLFAVRCARRLQHLMTDPRSIAVLDVAERHANRQATDEELKVARAAANAAWAAGAAAWAAANAALDAANAAWAAGAARDAARAAGAARDAVRAAGAAAWATARPADAVSAAAAARDAELAEQKKIFDEIRKEAQK